MANIKKQIEAIFAELNQRVSELNDENRNEGVMTHKKSQVTLLGQMSLMVDEKVSAQLSLAQTADLDAFLKTEFVIKVELKKILLKYGYVYDEDSPLIWIPPGATFVDLFDFDLVSVNALDAESALVSKAVKAPQKNKHLVQDALASNLFVNLADRIVANDGKLENFV